jgi:hypothetical protein
MNKFYRDECDQFYSWWNQNKERIERKNLHSFSGMYRNTLGPQYYRDGWAFRQMIQPAYKR